MVLWVMGEGKNTTRASVSVIHLQYFTQWLKWLFLQEKQLCCVADAPLYQVEYGVMFVE